MVKGVTAQLATTTATSTVVIILGHNGMLPFTASLLFSSLLVLFVNAFEDKDKDKLWIKISNSLQLLLLLSLQITQVNCMAIPHKKLKWNMDNQLISNQWTMATDNQQLTTSNRCSQLMVSTKNRHLISNQFMVKSPIKQVITNNLCKTMVNEAGIVSVTHSWSIN